MSERANKRTKVPRASLAYTILDDPDYIGLMMDASGLQAFAVFCALLVAAKVQDNEGKFKHPTAVIASMVRLPVDFFQAGLATLAQRTNWVVVDGTTVTIRSYKKWNSWGGGRDGAGRKSSCNQDAIKSVPSVSVSVTGSLTAQDRAHEIAREPDPVRDALAEVNGETTPGGDPTPDDDPQFETFWQHYPPVNKHGRAEAERAWFRLTPAERAKAAATVAAYAKAKATGPPDHRRRVLKPANWLESRVFDQDPATWLPAQETSKVSAQFARSDDAYFSQS